MSWTVAFVASLVGCFRHTPVEPATDMPVSQPAPVEQAAPDESVEIEEWARWTETLPGLEDLSLSPPEVDLSVLGADDFVAYTAHPGVLGLEQAPAECVALSFTHEQPVDEAAFTQWSARLPPISEGEVELVELVELGAELRSGFLSEQVLDGQVVGHVFDVRGRSLGAVVSATPEQLHYGLLPVMVVLETESESFTHACEQGDSVSCSRTRIVPKIEALGPVYSMGGVSGYVIGPSPPCECPVDEHALLLSEADAYFAGRTFWRMEEEIVLYRDAAQCQAALENEPSTPSEVQ